MKKKKGFTLIELLAVIIILAIIALIAVPQVLKILNKARLAAAEDSTYGIVDATENYTGNLMLKNNGAYPNFDLEFECNGSCKLTEEMKTKLQNYDLTGLEELTFKGSKPKGGRVIIKDNGKTTIVENLIINGFTCNYNNPKVLESNGVAVCKKGDETEEPDIPTPPEPEIINITLTFNAMGGSVDIDSKEVTYNESYGELPIPTKENYTFVGWYTMPTYTVEVTSESIVNTKENQTLYAKWKGITTTVSFDSNGGIGETPSKTITYGEKYGELPSVTKEGYKFNGWYTENNGGTRVTEDTIVNITGEQTLYAHWIGENTTISFNAMGGSVSPTSMEVVYGEKIGNLPTPSRENYTFVGWYTLPTYTIEVTSDTIVSTKENQTLYAKWKGNEYTVNFDANGGNVSQTSKTVIYGDTYGTLPTPSRSGYQFNGWYTATSGGTKIINTSNVEITGSQTLYAHWTEEVCNNYTRSVSCSKTCANGTSASGTRVDTYNCHGNLVSTGVCNATCSNYTKTNTCTTTCGNGSVSGTRVDTYNGNTGTLISTGTCNATCPSGPSGATLTATPSDTVSVYNTTYVILTATVTSGATISKYEFYNGSTLLGTQTTSSQSASIKVSSLATSNMNFRVVITDIYGRTATASVTESCSLNETTTCYNNQKYQIYTCTGSNRQYSTTIQCQRRCDSTCITSCQNGYGQYRCPTNNSSVLYNCCEDYCCHYE